MMSSTSHRLLRWLWLPLAAVASCGPPGGPDGPRRAPPRPRPAVDCSAYCGRLYLCFDDFLAAADPQARAKLRHMKRQGLYDQVRRTTLGACQGECRRAAYRDEAARVVNGCLARPGCPSFGRCVMDWIYRVDCNRLCQRAWIRCLPDLLVTARSLRPNTVATLRRSGRLRTLGAREYTECVLECRKRSGHGPNALGINLCLQRPRCASFARCLGGFFGPVDPTMKDCVRLYDRYLRCRDLTMTRGQFVTLCTRLRARPRMRAEIHCALQTSCAGFEACLKRIPAARPRPRPAAPPRARPASPDAGTRSPRP